MILKLISDTVSKLSTAGCQSWLTAYLDCFNSDNSPKKNIDSTILLCHKSSEQQLSETLSPPTIDDLWLVLALLRWRPLPFQSWYQSHDRTSQGSRVYRPLIGQYCDNPGLSLAAGWVTTQEKLTTTIIFPPRTKLLCFYFEHISRGGGF